MKERGGGGREGERNLKIKKKEKKKNM